MKKNIDLKHTLQFGGVFLLLMTIILVFGLGDTEPIWNREFGDFISEMLLMMLLIGVLFLLPFYIRLKREGDKHRRFHERNGIPFANNKGECYCSSEEVMDAFNNPNDPILNPRGKLRVEKEEQVRKQF